MAINRTKQTVIAPNIEFACTPHARRVGLLQHESLEEGYGLVIPAHTWLPFMAIHTIGMRFSIDVIFVDDHMRVLDVCTLPPTCVKSVFGAQWVLETVEGTIVASRTERGDEIEFINNA